MGDDTEDTANSTSTLDEGKEIASEDLDDDKNEEPPKGTYKGQGQETAV